MPWWKPHVRKTLNPPPDPGAPRPPPPASQEPPLVLTRAMAIRPTVAMWSRANAMFEHPTGCRCSTCTTTAELAWLIRDHDRRAASAST